MGIVKARFWRRYASLLLTCISALLVGLTAASPSGIACSIVLIALGFFIQRDQQKQHQAQQQAIAAHLEDLQKFGSQLLPVWSGHIESSRAQTEAAISALALRFAGIVDRLNQITLNNLESRLAVIDDTIRALRGEINEALVLLQFQDRVSQVLSHVKRNIDSVPPLLDKQRDSFEHEQHLPLMNAADLLAALESTYVMDQERSTHLQQAGNHAGKPGAPQPQADDEITYF